MTREIGLQLISQARKRIDDLRSILQKFEHDPPGVLSPTVMMDIDGNLEKAVDGFQTIKRRLAGRRKSR